MLLRFAKKFGYGDRLNIVSLGQGQGPYAKQLIENGTKSGSFICINYRPPYLFRLSCSFCQSIGDWVVLQNCMLAKSWMPELDKIIFELQERAVKDDGTYTYIRVYLHSYKHIRAYRWHSQRLPSLPDISSGGLLSSEYPPEWYAIHSRK